jgi:hypothetical protein
MHYFMHQFDKDGKTFSQEVSTLSHRGAGAAAVIGQLANGTQGITITDPDKGETYTFVFYCVDKDASGEDTYGWRCVVTMDTVTKYPHMQGTRVLIFNN